MRRTFAFPAVARFCATACAGLALLTLTACDSGGSKSKSAGSTTTSYRAHHTTTSTKPAGTTTSSAPPTSITTVPRPSSTTLPNDGGTCGGATGAITAAVLGGDLGPVPVGSYTVVDCRQSASQPIWAAVTLRARPGQTVPQLTVALQRIGALWTVHSYSQGPTGCDAPRPVPTELRLGC
jgi:hypothetical protein